jgi:hypothetical protein
MDCLRGWYFVLRTLPFRASSITDDLGDMNDLQFWGPGLSFGAFNPAIAPFKHRNGLPARHTATDSGLAVLAKMNQPDLVEKCDNKPNQKHALHPHHAFWSYAPDGSWTTLSYPNGSYPVLGRGWGNIDKSSSRTSRVSRLLREHWIRFTQLGSAIRSSHTLDHPSHDKPR